MTLHDEGKRSATIRPVSRRKALKLAASGAAAAAAGLAAPAVIAAGNDKLLIGVPSSLSTPYGVADDTDHLNGTKLGRRGDQCGRRRARPRDRAVRAGRRQAVAGKLPPGDRRLHRQEGARDFQRLPLRADPGDG